MEFDSFPIRFLKYFRIRQENLLFAGIGGNLKIFQPLSPSSKSTKNRFELLRSESIFETNYTHGIERNEFVFEKENEENVFCVYGQRFFRIVKISYGISGDGNVEDGKLELRIDKGPTENIDDWIWAAKWISNDELAFLLGHNQVTIWSSKERMVKRTIQCEECCILYSGIFVQLNAGSTECSITSDNRSIIALSGTVFNEILIWLPFDEGTSAKAVHRLIGHQGVIFGITSSLLPDVIDLCTVSDDRSCRLWRFRSMNTDQSNRSSSMVTMEELRGGSFESTHAMYGHEARVWRSIFIDGGKMVVSVGEDGDACLWNVDSGRLCKKWTTQRGGIRAIVMDPSSKYLICGTDSGCICSIRMPTTHLRNGEEDAVANCSYILPQHLKEYITCVFYTNSDQNRNATTTKSSGECSSWLGVTNRGTIIHSINGETRTILQDPSLRYTAGDRIGDRLILGGLDGKVYLIDCGGELKLEQYQPIKGKVFSTHFVGDSGQFVLICGGDGQMTLYNSNTTSNDQLQSIANFRLPPGKHRWSESAAYLRNIDRSDIDHLIVGDRNGGVYFYRWDSKEHQIDGDFRDPTQSFPKIHGSKEVTDFSIDRGYSNILHSIGRDGCWRKWKYYGDPSKAGNSKWRVVYCEKLMQNFEWASKFVQYQGELLIAGFKSNKFVLFNTKTEQYLCEIECGGGHRSYDMQIICKDSADDGSMTNEEESIRLLYTKNGQACEAIVELDSIVDVLPSIHLRRITDVVVLDQSIGDEQSMQIATCSEDTTIGIWSINGDSITLNQRLKSHISSVHCLYSVRHQSTSSTSSWLISGGGRSELCWWTKTDDAIGYRLMYRHKDKDDDVRCMALRMCTMAGYAEDGGNRRDLVVAVYSNGRMSFFSTPFSPIHRFVAPSEIARLQSTCCLNRVSILHSDEAEKSRSIPPVIFTIGTDGKLYVIDRLKELIESRWKVGKEDEEKEEGKEMADVEYGEEDEKDSTDEEEEIDPHLSIYTRSMKNRQRRRQLLRMEQAAASRSIDSAGCEISNEIVDEDLGKFGRTFMIERAGLTALDSRMVVDAGDQIHMQCLIGSESGVIHLLNFQISIDDQRLRLINTMRFPDWHTSTVTGLSITPTGHVISNGIDQRVGIWSIDDSGGSQVVSLDSNRFSHVADASTLRLFSSNHGEYAMICGAGIQLIRYR